MVGETGFEPATPWTQTKCATKLRYSPTYTSFSNHRFAQWLRVADITDLILGRQTIFENYLSDAENTVKKANI